MKFVLSLVLPSLLLLAGCACEKKTILSIGGCDAGAWCHVKYTDGTLGYQQYPVVGQDVKECH